MNHQHQAMLAIEIVHAIFLAQPPGSDRIDEFQMARVEAQREMNLVAVAGDVLRAVAQVVFHVAAAAMQGRLEIFELVKNLLRAFADDVRQHVQPTAMRHSDHDLVDPLASRLFDGQVQERNQAFGPFQRKALRPQ